MRAAPRGPTTGPRPPAGTVLARLDAALGAAHAALSAAHPAAAGPRFRPAAAPAPPLRSIAALVIKRSAELRRLLVRYQRTSIDDHQPGPDDRDERQGAFPF